MQDNNNVNAIVNVIPFPITLTPTLTKAKEPEWNAREYQGILTKFYKNSVSWVINNKGMEMMANGNGIKDAEEKCQLSHIPQ